MKLYADTLSDVSKHI